MLLFAVQIGALVLLLMCVCVCVLLVFLCLSVFSASCDEGIHVKHI